MILPIGVPLETNVNGAQRTTFFQRLRRRQNASTSPSSLIQNPPPEATTAPTTSPSPASASPPSPSKPAISTKATTQPGAKKQHEDFTAHDYHNFTDNYHADWDFAGNAKLDRFGMDLGWQALTAPTTINWLPKTNSNPPSKPASERNIMTDSSQP